MKKIKIGNLVPFDKKDQLYINYDRFIETRGLFTASSGGGKSFGLRQIIEQAFGKSQILILDTEGEFSTLRPDYDFVLLGHGLDVSLNPLRGAEYATKFLETGHSAVFDLFEMGGKIYDLKTQKQQFAKQVFVRDFLDAMTAARRELWHDALIILDEAHEYAPEKSPSCSSDAVISMAAKGRKRGFALLMATQRPAKLSKDASAECSNKIIGLQNLPDDRKRAAEELGFSSKEEILTLRDMEAGAFYVCGPAFMRGDDRFRGVGQAVLELPNTRPPKRGLHKAIVPKASVSLKKELAKLAELPKEVEEEAATVSEMRIQISDMKRQLKAQPKDVDKAEYTKVASRMIKEAEAKALMEGDRRGREAVISQFRGLLKELKAPKLVLLEASLKAIAKSIGEAQTELPEVIKSIKEGLTAAVDKASKTPPLTVINANYPVSVNDGVNAMMKPWPVQTADVKKYAHMVPPIKEKVFAVVPDEELSFGKCERSILTLLNSERDRTFSRVQAGVMTGYSHGSGSFSTAISNLRTSGYLTDAQGGRLYIPTGLDVSTYAVESRHQLRDWFGKLGKCERQILEALLAGPEQRYTREELAGDNYSPGSGSFSTALSNLASVGLLAREGGMILLNPEIKEWA